MNRVQFAHILRAAAAISRETVFVVVGSQAVLGQFEKLPAIMARSVEVDLYPKLHPELAEVIEGAIGQDSMFHEQFGYHADAVGPETARLPRSWQQQAISFRVDEAEAICPEIHDLAVSKLLAGREKDLEWLEAGVAASLIEPGRVAALLDETDADSSARQWLASALCGCRAPGNDGTMNEERQRAYLLEIARRLRGPEAGGITARAGRLVDKWEAEVGAHPRYIDGWRTALASGADAVEAIALADTDDGAALRHCMPFAGILTNAERTKFRRKQLA